MRCLAISTAALATVWPLASTAAQRVKWLSTAEARQTMAKFADCLVARPQSIRSIRTFLRMSPIDPQFRTAVDKLAFPPCMPRSFARQTMSFQSPVLRSALFASLYRREHGRGAPTDLSKAPELSIASEFDLSLDGVPDELRYARILGDCLVRADSIGSHALVFSQIGSEKERAATEALMPSLRGCIARDHTARLNQSALRGLVAESLYKLSAAQSAAQRVN